MLRSRLLPAATRLMMPPVAITARRPTAWRGALLAARCSSGEGEHGEMRLMPFIGLSLGYAASIFATPVNASGSDADDSDATADEPGGESRADFVLRRRKEQEEKLRRRRREDRGGGDPTPRGQLHVSNEGGAVRARHVGRGHPLCDRVRLPLQLASLRPSNL